MTVKVVKPIKITEAVLAASSIPEPDASVGEVEFVPDRRKVMDVDFLGNTVTSNDYGRAHFLPTNPYGFDHGSVYFEKVLYPGDTTTIEMLKYNVTHGAQGFQCYYDSITSCDVSGFIDANNTRFLCCSVERYSLSNTTGRSCFFIANIDSDNISAIFASNFTLAQTSVTLEKPEISISLYEAHSYNIFVIDGEFYGFFFHSPSYKYYFQKWNSQGQLVGPAVVVQDYLPAYAMLYLDGNFRAYRTYSPFNTDFYYSGDNNLAAMTKIKMPQSYEANARTVFTDGDNIFISYGDNTRIEIFTAGTGASLGYYQPNERAILTSTHKLYQCVKATNIRPDLGATGDESETWIEVGPTNRWSQFVDTITSYTESNVSYTFNLKPNEKFTSVAFFGCSGIDTIVINVKDSSGGHVQAVTLQMIDSDAELEWGLDPNSPAFIDQAFVDGLQWSTGYYLHVRVNPKTGFTSKIKLVAFGIDRLIGEAVNESMRKNYIDLSSYKNDQFGNTRITKRPVVGLNTYSALVDGVRIDVVDRFLNSLAGEFNVWIADIGAGQKILTYGAYERAPTEINHNSYRNYVATIRSAI